MALFSEDEYREFEKQRIQVPDSVDARMLLEAQLEQLVTETLGDRRLHQVILRSLKKRGEDGVAARLNGSDTYWLCHRISFAVSGSGTSANPALFFPYDGDAFCGAFVSKMNDPNAYWFRLSTAELARRLSYVEVNKQHERDARAECVRPTIEHFQDIFKDEIRSLIISPSYTISMGNERQPEQFGLMDKPSW